MYFTPTIRTAHLVLPLLLCSASIEAAPVFDWLTKAVPSVFRPSTSQSVSPPPASNAELQDLLLKAHKSESLESQVERFRNPQDPHPKTVLEARERDRQYQRRRKAVAKSRAQIHKELTNHLEGKDGYYHTERLMPKSKGKHLNYNYHVTDSNWMTTPAEQIDYDREILHPHNDHPEQAKAYRKSLKDDYNGIKIEREMRKNNSKVKEEALKHIALGGVIESKRDNGRVEYLHHPDLPIGQLRAMVEEGHARQLKTSDSKEQSKVLGLVHGSYRQDMDKLAIKAQNVAIKHQDEMRKNRNKGRHYENEDGPLTEHHEVSDTEAPLAKEWNPFIEGSSGGGSGSESESGQRFKGKRSFIRQNALKRRRSPSPSPIGPSFSRIRA